LSNACGLCLWYELKLKKELSVEHIIQQTPSQGSTPTDGINTGFAPVIMK
jgi:hypothetical protein